MKVVPECALRGESAAIQQRNLRYALWCCRFVRLLGHTVYASHTNAPWFLDDAVETERNLGISLTEEITDNSWEHWFFNDFSALTESSGTRAALERFIGELKRDWQVILLNPDRGVKPLLPGEDETQTLRTTCWHAFVQGQWPPHTAGFVVQPSEKTASKLNIPLTIDGKSLDDWATSIHLADTYSSLPFDGPQPGGERVKELLVAFLHELKNR